MSENNEIIADNESERIKRERDFHNDRFGNKKDKTISVADRYNMIRPSMDDYAGRVLAHCKNARVLEYGCGPNTYAKRIIDGGARSVTGIDISDEAIRISERNAKADAPDADMTFIRMNAEALEFPDNSFDLVCGVAILHHLDLQKAIPEIRRVLVPGGHCVFIEPLDHNPMLRLYRAFTPSIRTPDEHPLLKSDMDMILKGTKNADMSFHNFTSLPMHFLGKVFPDSMFGPTVKAFQSLDRFVFKAIPVSRWWAWSIVFEFQKG